jgi:hypothetical protein
MSTLGRARKIRYPMEENLSEIPKDPGKRIQTT